MTKELLKQALEALEQTLKTLENENEKPNGAIADTIWYSGHETLFDYLTSQITVLRQALEQPEQDIVQRLSALVRAQQITIDKLEQANSDLHY